MKGFEINDNPFTIKKYSKYFFKEPMLLNIKTNRLFWHAGAGKDSDKTYDRYKNILKSLGKKAEIEDLIIKKKIENKWQTILKQL